MSLIEHLRSITQQSKDYDDLVIALRDAVVSARSEGISKAYLITQLENLYNDVHLNEVSQNAILDVWDFVHGFCSPHMKID